MFVLLVTVSDETHVKEVITEENQRPLNSGILFQRPLNPGILFQKPLNWGLLFQRALNPGILFQRALTQVYYFKDH